MRIANHRKEGFFLTISINRPTGIKYLMTAMLAVRLGKHNQFNITWITF